MTVFDIAKRVGIRKDRTERLLNKLISNDVCSITENGVLYCHRIVREEKRRSQNFNNKSLKQDFKKGDNHLESQKNSFDYRQKVKENKML